MKSNQFLDQLDLSNEFAVRHTLQNEGFFSSEHAFPIPCLQLELTSHCNVICRHCYNNSGTCNNALDIMTEERWVSFVEYIVNNGGIFECILSGGEPFLLGDHLFEIMDILHNDGTCFMLLTNGYMITDHIAKRLQKYRYHWLQISIDGTSAEHHDFFRQRKGSWEHAVNAAKLISKYNIPLKIAHCVTPYNLDDIDDMCGLAYSIGASAITVGELCFSGRAAKNQDLMLNDIQRNVLYQKVKENQERYKNSMRVKTSNSIREGLERHREMPRSGAIIRPNGDIRIDGMAPFVVGNILKDDFTDVWQNKLDSAWKSPKVEQYILGFNEQDRNNSLINYVDDDIYI